MQVIKEFPKGTVMFDAPTSAGPRRILPGVPWPVVVFYDPAGPSVPPAAVPAAVSDPPSEIVLPFIKGVPLVSFQVR